MNTAEIRIETMGKAELEETTRRIKEHLEGARRLIHEVYTREGWKAGGYSCFKHWANSELNNNFGHVFRMLRAAQLECILTPGPSAPGKGMGADPEEQINELWFPTGNQNMLIGQIPEGTLRPLAELYPDEDVPEDEREEARRKIRDAWNLANDRTNGKPTGEAVKEAVDIVLGRNDPLPGLTSFLDDEGDDESETESLRPAPPSDAEKAADAWTELLTHFSQVWTSLQRRGGIRQLSRRWTQDRKRGYVERCREISEIFEGIAGELEAELP